MSETVNLGDKVKDLVSGFEGTAISTHHYLYGCVRVCVVSRVGEDNVFKSGEYFDEPQLEVLERAKQPETKLLQQEGG